MSSPAMTVGQRRSATAGAPALELGAVYVEHAQRVGRWAARLAGPGLDVEDLVQEVFLTVQRLLPSFRGDAELTTWLYRITENVVRHRRRKERLRRWLRGAPRDYADDVESPQRTPVEALEAREAQRLIYEALDGMSEKYRTVLILFSLENLSGEEIAALTGAKVATVWVWLHRARAQLADRLAAIEARASSRGGAAARAESVSSPEAPSPSPEASRSVESKGRST